MKRLVVGVICVSLSRFVTHTPSIHCRSRQVVMHREGNMRGRSPSISTHGSLEQHETFSLNGTPDSNPWVPQRILATPVATVDSAANPASVPPSGQESERNETPLWHSREVEADLDATPRIGTASSQVVDPTSNGPAPMFPMGVFGRRRRNSSG